MMMNLAATSWLTVRIQRVNSYITLWISMTYGECSINTRHMMTTTNRNEEKQYS